MTRSPLRILQASTADRLGGAERIAWNLFDAYRREGYTSCLAVGRRYTSDPDVFEIRNDHATTGFRRAAWHCFHTIQPYYGRSSVAKRLAQMAHRVASPQGARDRAGGIEDFNFSGTARLLDLPPAPPDILHLHNLHGGYFDLRELPNLCASQPVFMTLHDAWLLAGHCAHSLGCERWRTGCGDCPDLSIYPAVRCDATAENWSRKREILSRCRLHIATPSQWLMERVRQSILAPAIIDARVIPNGVDQSIFHPGCKREARCELGLPVGAVILLTTAGGQSNPFKDYDTILAAARRAASDVHSAPIVLIALGQPAGNECFGGVHVRRVAQLQDSNTVASYYRAADLYVHASKADTFPSSVIEALSCGTPVVATSVGGIPEQIRSWPLSGSTGILTRPGCHVEMGDAIRHVLIEEPLRRGMAIDAARVASEQFGLARQVRAYLDWYDAVLTSTRRDRRPSTSSALQPA